MLRKGNGGDYKVVNLKLLLMREIHPRLMASADVHTDTNSIKYLCNLSVRHSEFHTFIMSRKVLLLIHLTQCQRCLTDVVSLEEKSSVYLSIIYCPQSGSQKGNF